MIRMSADVGGTFTDVVLQRPMGLSPSEGAIEPAELRQRRRKGDS